MPELNESKSIVPEAPAIDPIIDQPEPLTAAPAKKKKVRRYNLQRHAIAAQTGLRMIHTMFGASNEVTICMKRIVDHFFRTAQRYDHKEKKQ
jgi:hypothetical protein